MAEPAPRRLSNHKKLTRRLGPLHWLVMAPRLAAMANGDRNRARRDAHQGLDERHIEEFTLAGVNVAGRVNPVICVWFASVCRFEAERDAHLHGRVVEVRIFIVAGGEDLSGEVQIPQLLVSKTSPRHHCGRGGPSVPKR